MPVPVMDPQPSGDSGRPVDPSSAIVIADKAEMRSRIAAALAAHDGLQPAAQIDDPAAIAELDTDASTIIIFACKADAGRDIARLRRLRGVSRDPAIVVISPSTTGTGVRRTLDAGADALVFESELESTLAATISAVASGQSVVPREHRAGVERPILSHREYQVLALVRQGLTNAEIAASLFLAESTIKSHLGSVFTKFGVHSRKEAVAVIVDLELSANARHGTYGSHNPSEQTVA